MSGGFPLLILRLSRQGPMDFSLILLMPLKQCCLADFSKIIQKSSRQCLLDYPLIVLMPFRQGLENFSPVILMPLRQGLADFPVILIPLRQSFVNFPNHTDALETKSARLYLNHTDVPETMFSCFSLWPYWCPWDRVYQVWFPPYYTDVLENTSTPWSYTWHLYLTKIPPLYQICVQQCI